MNNKTRSISKLKILEVVFRYLLGVLFVYASFHKITDPSGFAKVIYGYYLFPAQTINLIAIIIPYLELIAGISLLAGFFPRAAVSIVNVLLLSFIIAISINLIRGHEFDCGCFAIGKNKGSSAAVSLLIRDIFYLMMGVYVYLYKSQRILCFKED